MRWSKEPNKSDRSPSGTSNLQASCRREVGATQSSSFFHHLEKASFPNFFSLLLEASSTAPQGGMFFQPEMSPTGEKRTWKDRENSWKIKDGTEKRTSWISAIKENNVFEKTLWESEIEKINLTNLFQPGLNLKNANPRICVFTYSGLVMLTNLDQYQGSIWTNIKNQAGPISATNLDTC